MWGSGTAEFICETVIAHRVLTQTIYGGGARVLRSPEFVAMVLLLFKLVDLVDLVDRLARQFFQGSGLEGFRTSGPPEFLLRLGTL